MNATIRPNANDFDSLEDYCYALRTSGLKSFTADEQACLLREELDAKEESYHEHYTQYRSECALFGDAGPGQGLVVRDLARDIADLRERLARVRRIAAAQAA